MVVDTCSSGLWCNLAERFENVHVVASCGPKSYTWVESQRMFSKLWLRSCGFSNVEIPMRPERKKRYNAEKKLNRKLNPRGNAVVATPNDQTLTSSGFFLDSNGHSCYQWKIVHPTTELAIVVAFPSGEHLAGIYIQAKKEYKEKRRAEKEKKEEKASIEGIKASLHRARVRIAAQAEVIEKQQAMLAHLNGQSTFYSMIMCIA